MGVNKTSWYIYKGKIRTTIGGMTLINGSEVELPVNDRRVQRLVAQGLLEIRENRKK